MMNGQAAFPPAQSAASQPLRGDYSNAAPDYTIRQKWDRYSAEEHALYRRLYERQSVLVRRHACPAYLDALGRMGGGDAIPRLDQVTAQLRGVTGWELVAVPGLLPDRAFFSHLADRRFPVTVWLRRPR